MLAEQGVIRLADFTDDETISDGAATSTGDSEDTDEPDASTDAGAGDDAGAEADIEDLFSEDFYIELVNRSGAATIEAFELLGSDRIVKRIEEATGLGLDRFRPARLLLDGGEISIDALDDESVDRFENLFRKINGILRADHAFFRFESSRDRMTRSGTARRAERAADGLVRPIPADHRDRGHPDRDGRADGTRDEGRQFPCTVVVID